MLFGIGDIVICHLQSLQHAVAHLVTNMSHHDHITGCLHQLHWLPVHYHIIYKIATLVYKSVHGLASAYLASYLTSTIMLAQ